jgi:hypothetical protein
MKLLLPAYINGFDVVSRLFLFPGCTVNRTPVWFLCTISLEIRSWER